MCDTNNSATLSNAQRAHDLAMQCVSNLTSADNKDLKLIADEYLKSYVYFWDALNDYVRNQSEKIAEEYNHHHEHHDHGHHHGDGHHHDGHGHHHHNHPHKRPVITSIRLDNK